MPFHRLLFLAVFSSILAANVASAAPPADTGVALGEILYEDGKAVRETVSLSPLLLAKLSAVRHGDRIDIVDFPVGPGLRAAVTLERVDLYAPEARIWEVVADGLREVPRSADLHFLGRAVDDPTLRVGISLEPARGTMNGLVGSESGHRFFTAGPSFGTVEIVEASHLLPEGVELEYLPCGTTDEPLSPKDRILATGAVPILFKGAIPTREAVIGVDTDNEFMSLKFGNSTAAAAGYIADLFLEMNVIYERDLQLRMIQGTTFLRTTPDPYQQSSTSTQLAEFADYWDDNYDAIERVFAMLLSGKSPSSNQAAGRGDVGGYCEQSRGYNVNQVFKIPGDLHNASYDVSLVAHELGHNFGSPHTHCYDPPVDQCWNGEAFFGCYAGTESCPAGGQGTLMSYCHLGACGSADVLQEFHPTVIGFLDAEIDANHPGCVEDLGASATQIFSDGFESGNTSAWSSEVP